MILDNASVLYNLTIVSVPEFINQVDMLQIISETRVKTIFCELYYLERLLTVLSNSHQLHQVQNIVCLDNMIPDNIFESNQAKYNIFNFQSLISKGQNEYIQNYCKVSPDSVYTINYRLTEEGDYLGAMITHRNMISTLGALWNNNLIFPQTSDTYLSSLPFSHIYERVALFVLSYAGAAIGFLSGEPNKLFEDLKILRPTIICGVPQLYNTLYDQVQLQIKQLSGLSKDLADYAISKKTAQINANPSDLDNLLLDQLSLKQFQEQLGGKLRMGFVSGASSWPHKINFLRLIFSIPIIEM